MDCKIDEELLAEIEEAQSTLYRTEAVLAGEGAQLHFVSHTVQDVEVNGVFQKLAPA